VYVRRNHLGLAIVLSHVDDVRIWGDKAAIEEIILRVKEHLQITIEDHDKAFLGCDIIQDKKTKTCYMIQTPIIDKLIKSSTQKASKVKILLTPGTPGKSLQKAIPSEEGHLNPMEMKEYRSKVGSLMYLLKHSRPELSNCVQELAKRMQGAVQVHKKELDRITKWVLSTPKRALKMKPIKEDNTGKNTVVLKEYVMHHLRQR